MGIRRSTFAPAVRAAAVYAAVFLLATAAPAQAPLDLGDWTLEQESSTQTFTIPAGTFVEPGGYVIICRDQDQTSFESYYGVTLGSNVVFLRSSNSAPMINGDETYELRNGGGATVDGPTDAVTTTRRSYHRNAPETLAWSVVNETPSPGSGVEAPDGVFSGMVISEVTDPDDYTYEYVELYCDQDTGSGNLAPLIGGVDLAPASPQAGDDLTVSATITDTDGTVSAARCYYRTDGGAFAYQAMAHTGGGVYETVFPDQPGNVDFDYYVWARDDESAESTAPAGAPASFYTVWIQGPGTPGRVVLFDHMHDQDAGTGGNWRVDDNHPDPYPAAPTGETSWNGQLSSWGYELYLAGHTIRSNTAYFSAALLADVDMVVIVEPQDTFSAAEIAALGQWVYDGGSLFVVANHNASDRNGNGWDSPSIFGGYAVPHITDPVGADSETFCGALFCLHFHVKDEGNNSITGTFTNVTGDPQNPVIHGSYGDVSAVIYHVGDVMSLWPTANPHLSDVGALISKDEGSPHVAAWSRYGDGKIVGFGDSSSCADGTGSETHEDNWTEVGSDNREFFLNASEWLLDSPGTGIGDGVPHTLGLELRAHPNPFNPRTSVSFDLPRDAHVEVTVHDLQGRTLRTLHGGVLSAGPHSLVWGGTDDAGRPLASGVYLVRAAGAGLLNFTKVVLAR
ncbi:hypothetical protein KJ554_11110 [bacterium]|nr:hypothetical protein [bacterium]